MSESYDRYAKIRDSKHLKNGTVSAGTGISRSFFSEWKAGKYEPKLDKIVKISEFLGCEVMDIISTDYVFNVPRPDMSDEYTTLIEVYSSLDDEGRKLFMEIALNMSERAKLINREHEYYKKKSSESTEQ